MIERIVCEEPVTTPQEGVPVGSAVALRSK